MHQQKFQKKENKRCQHASSLTWKITFQEPSETINNSKCMQSQHSIVQSSNFNIMNAMKDWNAAPWQGLIIYKHSKMLTYLFFLNQFFQPWQFQLLLMLSITRSTVNSLISYFISLLDKTPDGQKRHRDYYQHWLEMIHLSLPHPFATLYNRKHKS